MQLIILGPGKLSSSLGDIHYRQTLCIEESACRDCDVTFLSSFRVKINFSFPVQASIELLEWNSTPSGVGWPCLESHTIF